MIKMHFCLYRQLLSWYTLSQNDNVSSIDNNNPALHPLWVRCDMADPAGTTWFGAETVCMGKRVSGVKLYSVTCKGKAFINPSLNHYQYSECCFYSTPVIFDVSVICFIPLT